MKKILLIIILPILMGAGCSNPFILDKKAFKVDDSKPIVDNTESKSGEQEKVSQDILDIADNYIINKVGQLEFSTNYEYDSSQYFKAKDGTVHVYYNYKPATKVSDKTQYLIAKVKDNKIQYMNGLYKCDPSPCKINIDKNEAMAIATKKGFFDNGSSDGLAIYLTHSFNEFNYWAWSLSRNLPFDSRFCGKSLVMEINADTGQTTVPKEEMYCE